MSELENSKSGNQIVDRVGEIEISGNPVSIIWFKTVVGENNKPNLPAIIILSEIVYWYRPKKDRVNGGKKFKNDILQMSYSQLAEKFNLSKGQVVNAIKFLEKLGVIERVFRTERTSVGLLPNVLFIKLVPDVLARLTIKNEGGLSKKVDTTLAENIDLCQNTEADMFQKTDTNTKTTQKISKETTTTGDDVVCILETPDDGLKTQDDIRNLFADYDFSAGEIKALDDAAGGNPDKIRHAKNLLDGQSKPIENVVGWLIAAIKGNYKDPISRAGKAVKDTGVIMEHELSEAAIKDLESRLLNQEYF